MDNAEDDETRDDDDQAVGGVASARSASEKSETTKKKKRRRRNHRPNDVGDLQRLRLVSHDETIVTKKKADERWQTKGNKEQDREKAESHTDWKVKHTLARGITTVEAMNMRAAEPCLSTVTRKMLYEMFSSM